MAGNSKGTGKETRVDVSDSAGVGVVGDGATVGEIHFGDRLSISIGHVTVHRSESEDDRPEEEQKAEADFGANPYLGLVAFQEKDADRFFGREKLTAKLWEKLGDLNEPGIDGAKTRLLPILGPSGSGKSSVARAGLISELARKPLPGSQKARVVIFTPGTRPLLAMAGVLAGIDTGEGTLFARADELETKFKTPNDRGEYDGLARAAHLLPDIGSSPLLVLVDQFEEIYSSECDDKERNRFVDNLLCAASDASGFVTVVFSMRSDFLEETQSHEALNRSVAENGQIVAAMGADELRRAIAKPAENAGHPLETPLVDLLIEQAKDRVGALPLLQFALTQIWEGMAKGEKPSDALKRIGGVGGALAKKADSLYSKLSPADQSIARRAFVAMVDLKETKDTRRRVRMHAIARKNENKSRVKKVLETFAGKGARLVSFSGKEGEESSRRVEITHEILLEKWKKLKGWLGEGREDLYLLRRLEDAAEHWKKNDGSLWRGNELSRARKLYKNKKEEFGESQEEFFKASRRAANQRLFMFFLAVALIVCGVSWSMYEINRERQIALENERKSNYHLALTYENNARNSLNAALRGIKPGENFQKVWLYALGAMNLDIPSDKELSFSRDCLVDRRIQLGLLYGADIASGERYRGFATKDKTVREWESDLSRPYERSGRHAPEFQAVHRCSVDLFPFEMVGTTLTATEEQSGRKRWYADYPRPARKDPVQWMIEATAKGMRDGKIERGQLPKAWIEQNAKADFTRVAARREPIENKWEMKFVYIEPGTFFMGSPLGEHERSEDETFHTVALTCGFYMQTTEVTQGQWEAVMGSNPSDFKECGSNCPVEDVSWDDVQEFIRKLNDLKGNSEYRLPTEAEWEYAARAGTVTPFSFGNCLSADQANYRGSSPMPGCPKGKYRETTVRAASFSPNDWGLYDMHGNVWEWCQDWYGAYAQNDAVDPKGPEEGAGRVLRGGSWDFKARYCRSADRGRDDPSGSGSSAGFRLAAPPGR